MLGRPDRHRRPVPRRRGAQPAEQQQQQRQPHLARRPLWPVIQHVGQLLLAGAFHDITSGNNGYPAGPGYDLVTGIGSPVANVLVPAWRNPRCPT